MRKTAMLCAVWFVAGVLFGQLVRECCEHPDTFREAMSW